MNSGEWNKIAGGVIGALLLFLLLGFASEMLYVGREGEGHGGERVLAFAVEVEEAGGTAEAAGPDWGALLASADAGAGASVFNKCKACHAVEDGQNGVGPHLYNVVGRDIAAVDGYAYSEALMSKEGVWDLESLFGFLHNPGGWAPGTKMGFAGLKDDQDKVDMIAWLNEQSASPVELVAPAGAEPATAEGEAAEETETAALETGEEAGLASTDERDAKDAGVESDGNPTKEVDLGDEEEAEAMAAAAMDEAAESGTRADATYSEQESGDDEQVPAGTDATDGGDGAVDRVDSDPPEEEADEETAAADTGTTAATGGAAAGLLASADAGEGEKVFRKCKACHRLEDGAKGVGPHLYGIVGREIASVDGYSYSDALKSKDGQWTLEQLDAFLADPKGWAPGTKMAFAGLADEQDRINVITYLNEADGSPEDLGAASGAGVQAAELSDTPGAKAMAEPEEVDGPDVGTAAQVESDPPVADEVAATRDDNAPTTEDATAEEDASAAEPAETAAATPAATEQQPAAAGGGAFATQLAAADAGNGEKVFRKCKACHRIEDGAKGVGPHLYGVIGRDIAAVDGYAYSDALASKDGQWTLEHLDAFLADPNGWAPGTKMTFAGVKDEQDRIDLITYLNEADGSPEPLGE